VVAKAKLKIQYNDNVNVNVEAKDAKICFSSSIRIFIHILQRIPVCQAMAQPRVVKVDIHRTKDWRFGKNSFFVHNSKLGQK
jgi:hypothetical protein